MFSKTLFLVVLCCAVVFANADPISKRALRTRRSPAAGDKVKAWWNDTTHKVDKWFKKVGNSFRTFWDRLTGAESRRLKQQLSELRAEYDLLKQQSAEAVNSKKAQWQREVEAQERKVREAREAASREVEAEERRLQKLKEAADRDVDNEMNTWDQKFGNLEARIEKVVN